MAYFDAKAFGGAGLGETNTTVESLVELGLMHAAGRDVPLCLVTAHKWFNIAALRGDKEAARLRREIAADMSDADIGAAQRAARDWLKANPETPRATGALRLAA